MSAKPSILILCDWFLPGYLAGGPIQSIATLTAGLGNEVHFRIITSDRDFQATTPYREIPVDTWTNYQGREVFYVSPSNMNPAFILELILATPHDGIYLNSLFSKLFTLYPLRWKKQGKLKAFMVLAPRGMLGDGALAIKPLKKKLFLLMAKSYGLFSGITWQSTSAQETLEIRKRIGDGALIKEVSNLPNTAGKGQAIVKKAGELRLCFISRISGKKNLAHAIRVLTGINNLSLVFDVFGPVEDEAYWRTCQELAAGLSPGVVFSYRGALKPEAIGQTLGQYHALFLPTRNENYGHAIVEALQHERLLLISDQTPWRGLQQEGVGYDLPLTDEAAFAEAIRSLAALSQEEFDLMCRACGPYLDKKLDRSAIRDEYKKLFHA